MKKIGGPKTSPTLQQFQWIFDPIGYMEGTAQKYPDIFSSRVVGLGEVVFVDHPEGIQQLLSSDRKEFSSPGELNQVLAPMVGNTSIFLISGEHHRRQRQLLMPPFHGDRMRNYGQLITHLAEQALETIPVGQPFAARSAMQSISLGVILEAVFGVQDTDKYAPLRQLTTEMVEVFNSPLSSAFLFLPFLHKDLGAWSPWGKFLRQRQKLDDLLYSEIADRRAHPDPDRTDILSLLMAAQDEDGNGMTDRELRDELVSLLIAGHETTATAMTWALYWIHHLPEVRAKLMKELDEVDWENPDPMAITRLPYLTAVCYETLRIYPVAMLTFPRVAQQPVTLMGYDLEPGTIVLGCIYLLHQREDLYPEPKQFKPDRFLEKKFSNCEFLAFGGGVRRCIGEALAWFEMKLVLATILSRYELALAESKPVQPARRGVTLAPSGGVNMVVTGQRTPAVKAEALC